MSISDVFGMLRRRWYVVVAGLLLTAALVGGSTVLFPPNYTARGLVLLLPPVNDETAAGANPFLGLGGLEIPARVLVASYSSNAFLEDVAARAPDAEVTVMIEESTRGPVIAVDVIDTSASGALGILGYVSSSIPETLRTLQEEVGAPLDTTVTSIPLTMDSEATIDRGDSTRMLILAAVVGLALTVLAGFVIDAASMRPTRRRRGLASKSQVERVQPDLEVPPILHPAPADPRPAVDRQPSASDDGDIGAH